MDSAYDWEQMDQIRRGLIHGADAWLYAGPKIDWLQMFAIRRELEKEKEKEKEPKLDC